MPILSSRTSLRPQKWHRGAGLCFPIPLCLLCCTDIAPTSAGSMTAGRLNSVCRPVVTAPGPLARCPTAYYARQGAHTKTRLTLLETAGGSSAIKGAVWPPGKIVPENAALLARSNGALMCTLGGPRTRSRFRASSGTHRAPAAGTVLAGADRRGPADGPGLHPGQQGRL